MTSYFNLPGSPREKNKKTIKNFFTPRKIAIISTVVTLVAGGFLFFQAKKFIGEDKASVIQKSLSAFEKIARFLPIEADTKKEIEVINKYVDYFTKQDDIERTFLVMLQNNMELRPGGGFLGQYAILKIKNGQVVSSFVEDANLLDQRIYADIPAPYPFYKMMQVRKWKFRDSNFSPDFPTNAEKAEYFYRLAGGKEKFDGVVAVNADVLSHILELTGPIQVPGDSKVYNSDNVVLDLEERVEKIYIYNPNIDTQNRKWIIKKMAEVIVDKLMNLRNVPKIADLVLEELRNKNVMLNFEDQQLQSLAESVHWDGEVAQDWAGDYLMAVDANLGAYKSDYYMKREMSYDIDMTGEKPVVTLNILYTHTATYGDWRTSDYHSYLRIYVPKGANLLERKMVSYPNIQEDLGKTYFGFTLHVLINRQTNAMIKYELPAEIKNDYKLLIQKQSGVGDVPVKIHVKMSDGKEYNQEAVLQKDLKFEIK